MTSIYDVLFSHYILGTFEESEVCTLKPGGIQLLKPLEKGEWSGSL